MFCTVGLTEPNSESSHSQLYGKQFVGCIPQAILRYYSRQQICPRHKLCSPILLPTALYYLKTLVPLFWCIQRQQIHRQSGKLLLYDTRPIFQDSFEDFAAMLRNEKSRCQFDRISFQRRHRQTQETFYFCHSSCLAFFFHSPPQGYSSGCGVKINGKNRAELKACAQSLAVYMGREGTAMFHYKFKANVFPGRESRMSR